MGRIDYEIPEQKKILAYELRPRLFGGFTLWLHESYRLWEPNTNVTSPLFRRWRKATKAERYEYLRSELCGKI